MDPNSAVPWQNRLRETMQHGMTFAEAQRRSASSCLSHSVKTMSRLAPSGSGLSLRDHLVALAASQRALHRGLQVVVLKGINNNEISGGSIP